MSFCIIDKISDPGGAGVNEDVVGHTHKAVWVLDGATGLSKTRLLPGPSDAAWLAASYSRFIHENLENSEMDLRSFFGSLISAVVHSFDAERLRKPNERYEMPSAGLAFARLWGQRLQFATLGDCRIILRVQDSKNLSIGADDSVITTPSSPLQQLDDKIIHRIMELLQSGKVRDYKEARHAVQEELRYNRALMNVEGGYWVLGLDVNAARHLESGMIEFDNEQMVQGVLLSDGLYRLVDTFGVYANDAAFLAASRTKGLSVLLAELRMLEDDDPECRVYPRLKPKDDATGILFNVFNDSW
jgi:hypothetical protein